MLKYLKERRTIQGIDEALTHSDLHQPNIVGSHGWFVSKGCEHIVLDLCENSTLEDVIKARGCLIAPEVRKFGIELASAVRYLHDKTRIIHRDLRPRNIPLDLKMNIKIGDFRQAACFESLADTTNH